MRSSGNPDTSCRGSADAARGTVLRRLAILPLIAVALPLIACTTTASPSSPTSVAAPPVAPVASVANSPNAQPGQFFCADAYTIEPRGGRPPFTASGVGFESLSRTGFDPIPARGASLPWQASGGFFSKAPLYLDHGVTWAELTAIKGDVTFAWVPAGVWMGLQRASGRTYEAPTARFESCDRSYTGFLGGILTPTARACITLGIRSNLHPEVERFRVAIGKGACG